MLSNYIILKSDSVSTSAILTLLRRKLELITTRTILKCLLCWDQFPQFLMLRYKLLYNFTFLTLWMRLVILMFFIRGAHRSQEKVWWCCISEYLFITRIVFLELLKFSWKKKIRIKQVSTNKRDLICYVIKATNFH